MMGSRQSPAYAMLLAGGGGGRLVEGLRQGCGRALEAHD